MMGCMLLANAKTLRETWILILHFQIDGWRLRWRVLGVVGVAAVYADTELDYEGLARILNIGEGHN